MYRLFLAILLITSNSLRAGGEMELPDDQFIIGMRNRRNTNHNNAMASLRAMKESLEAQGEGFKEIHTSLGRFKDNNTNLSRGAQESTQISNNDVQRSCNIIISQKMQVFLGTVVIAAIGMILLERYWKKKKQSCEQNQKKSHL